MGSGCSAGEKVGPARKWAELQTSRAHTRLLALCRIITIVISISIISIIIISITIHVWVSGFSADDWGQERRSLSSFATSRHHFYHHQQHCIQMYFSKLQNIFSWIFLGSNQMLSSVPLPHLSKPLTLQPRATTHQLLILDHHHRRYHVVGQCHHEYVIPAPSQKSG